MATRYPEASEDRSEASGLIRERQAAAPARNAAQYRRAAAYTDKNLKDAKSSDLPVEHSREFDFIINVETAKVRGLTISQHVLLQATEVIG